MRINETEGLREQLSKLPQNDLTELALRALSVAADARSLAQSVDALERFAMGVAQHHSKTLTEAYDRVRDAEKQEKEPR